MYKTKMNKSKSMRNASVKTPKMSSRFSKKSKKTLKSTMRSKLSNKSKPEKKVLGLIFARWCMYCQQFQPTWEMMKKNNELKHIQFVEIEENDPQMVNSIFQSHGVVVNTNQGYPTIFKIKGGKIEYFSNERNETNIKNFILK